MHAKRAQWKPAACDTWEAKVILPRGALKANLPYYVKVIFYLTENMERKSYLALSKELLSNDLSASSPVFE